MLSTFIEENGDEKQARTFAAHHEHNGARATAMIVGVCMLTMAPKNVDTKRTRSSVKGTRNLTNEATQMKAVDPRAHAQLATRQDVEIGTGKLEAFPASRNKIAATSRLIPCARWQLLDVLDSPSIASIAKGMHTMAMPLQRIEKLLSMP